MRPWLWLGFFHAFEWMIHEITPQIPSLVVKGKEINTYTKYKYNKFTKTLEKCPGGEGKRRVDIAQERQQAIWKLRPGQAAPGTSRRVTKVEAKNLFGKSNGFWKLEVFQVPPAGATNHGRQVQCSSSSSPRERNNSTEEGSSPPQLGSKRFCLMGWKLRSKEDPWAFGQAPI